MRDVPLVARGAAIGSRVVHHRLPRRSPRASAGGRDVRRMPGGPHLDHILEGAGGDNASFAFLQLVIDEALGRLRPAQRRMVELRVEGYEVAEIAQKTQRSKRTVERSLQQAREKLGDLLHEET